MIDYLLTSGHKVEYYEVHTLMCSLLNPMQSFLGSWKDTPAGLSAATAPNTYACLKYFQGLQRQL